MKKTKTASSQRSAQDDLRVEYQFDYRKARPNRFAGRVDQDGIVITLDPDVSQVFTNSESVNSVLRALITSMPKVSLRIGSESRIRFDCNAIDRSRWPRGGAVFNDGLAPWPDQERSVLRVRLPGGPRRRSVFFGNPVLVTHETHTRVGWEWIG